jgi:ABC-type transport system substrate-binding protein
MQDAWSQIGVRATPRLIDFNALTDQWTNKRDFDVLLIPVQFPVDPDPTIIWSSNAAKPGGFNGSHWINSKIDDLCKQGAATYDINERKKIYAQFQEIYMTELPAAPLFYPKALYGINKRVGGIMGALGTFNRFQRCVWMKDVYVKDGK